MKFLKVGVTRESSTDLYVEVPDDFDPAAIMRASYRDEVSTIAAETTDGTDWDDVDWHKSVEVHEVAVVTESEAKQFMVGRLRGVGSPN